MRPNLRTNAQLWFKLIPDFPCMLASCPASGNLSLLELRLGEALLRSEVTPFNAWHHRIALFIAFATLLVIIAGALVTSEDAGLSVPDWPTSYGHYLRLPPWVGGVVYEHSHRMIATFTGLCTIVIAFWTWFVDRRRWMKVMAFGALGTIIAQGVLGGITVLHFLPPAISAAHATVAQTFFAMAVAIAMFTGRKWVEEVPVRTVDEGHPKLMLLCLYSLFFLYVQLVFGAMFRHHGMPWWPHVANSFTVTLILTWTAVRAILQFPKMDPIRRVAQLLLFLLGVQLALGFAAFLTRVVWAANANQSAFFVVTATVAHVAVGALLLAATAILTLQVWRRVPVGRKQEFPDSVGMAAES